MAAETTEQVLHELGEAKYVRLTTFRRDGSGRPTPVWVVRDGEDLLVTTGGGTAKVKRLRREPRVLVTRCDARGRAVPDAPVHELLGEVSAQEADQVRAARVLLAKYGLAYRGVRLVERVVGLLGRPDDQVTLVLHPLG